MRQNAGLCGNGLKEYSFVSINKAINFQSSTVSLTHSHTMTPFDAPGKQAF